MSQAFRFSADILLRSDFILRLTMSISVNSPSSMPTTIDSGSSLKVAVMAKEQQEVEGQMALLLIEAAQPPAPQPVGNSGHNVNTTA